MPCREFPHGKLYKNARISIAEFRSYHHFSSPGYFHPGLLMQRVEKTIFLSYRRTNAPWALAISQNLTHHGYDVFFDFNGIASGAFEQVILENIRARAHFLVLLTPSALERCSEPTDWLRREIETAFETKRNIVPLMLEGFDFATPGIASQLTGTLAPLRSYNALRIPVEFFEEAMQRMRERWLNVALDSIPHPASAVAQSVAKEQQEAAATAPTVSEKALTAQEWFERGFYASVPDEKVELYTEAIRLKPDYASAFYNRAIARANKSDLDGALQDYTEAIRLKPDYASAFYNRAIARANKGDLDGALQDYDQVIHLEPDDASAFHNRAIARADKGDLDGALQDYDQAIRLKPDYASAFDSRAVARKGKGDLDGALQDYDQAIRLDPDYASTFYNRAIARADKGDLDGALQDYDQAIRLKPDYASAFDNRAIARKGKGDLDGALQDYDQAIRLNPDYASTFYNRAIARADKGDLDGALQDYDQAIRLKPDYASAFYNRARAREAKGDQAAAEQDYKEAARLDPKLKRPSPT